MSAARLWSTNVTDHIIREVPSSVLMVKDKIAPEVAPA